MARFVSWRYVQEDWSGKHNAWADYLRLYDRHGNLVVNTGWMNFDGEYNSGGGKIESNISEIAHFHIRWIRDLKSHGGGYFRLWVKDDTGNEYQVITCKQCKSEGNNMTELAYRLPDNSNDSGWTIRDGRWRIRRTIARESNACIHVCACNMGNCSCRGNNICACQGSNCGAYACSCNTLCTNDCSSRGDYACSCVNRHDAVICQAHCNNNQCSCQSNQLFQIPELITSEGVNNLINDIKNAANKFSVNIPNNVEPVGYIMENHIVSIERNINSVYNAVIAKNPNFSFDYNTISSNMPTDIKGDILLDTYRGISNLATVINSLCTAYDTCPSNCVGYSICKLNCICNVQNLGGPSQDGYICPCNTQCKCNGECSGVCVNCSCNVQNTLAGAPCTVYSNEHGCHVV